MNSEETPVLKPIAPPLDGTPLAILDDRGFFPREGAIRPGAGAA